GVASAQFQVKVPGDPSFSDLGAAVTSAPYTYDWATGVLDDGSYDLRVVTTDAAGNVTTSPARTVLLDNSAPTGTITAPAAGAALRGAVVVSSDPADDGSGVTSAQLQLEGPDDSSFSDLGGALTASPYDHSWDTTAVADGSYDLRVVTTDGAGNTTTSEAR